MKPILRGSNLILLLVFAAALFMGFQLPWWSLAIAPFVGGLALSFRSEASPVIWLTLVAALSWIFPALVEDSATGMRISARVGAAMGLNSSVLAYVLLIGISASVAALAVLAGRSLGLAVQSFQGRQDRASKRAG